MENKQLEKQILESGWVEIIEDGIDCLNQYGIPYIQYEDKIRLAVRTIVLADFNKEHGDTIELRAWVADHLEWLNKNYHLECVEWGFEAIENLFETEMVYPGLMFKYQNNTYYFNLWDFWIALIGLKPTICNGGLSWYWTLKTWRHRMVVVEKRKELKKIETNTLKSKELAKQRPAKHIRRIKAKKTRCKINID